MKCRDDGYWRKTSILTNDLDAPAEEIADLYRRRWQIELFFSVMKQTFKITHFVGRSDNAIRIQVAIALIAYLLMKMLCNMAYVNQTLLETSKLVQTNLMQRRDFTQLKQQETRPPINSRQMSLNWAAT